MKSRNMRIFIVGSGTVGASLAANLSKDGCEVTIIDTNEEVLNSISNSADVIGYRGNGASYKTLSELRAGQADVLIAVTESDEINLLSCFTAHKLGTKHTIARIRDVDYASQNSFYREELGISLTINPDLATANEVFRTLRFPAATRIELFAGGRAELVELKLRDDSPILGLQLKDVGSYFAEELLVCAIVRDGRALVPKGDTTIMPKDTLYLTGTVAGFRKSFKKLNYPIRPLTSVMIAGNDRVTFYLANLLGSHGANVTVVDQDRSFCFDTASKLPKAAVMNEDALRYFDTMSESDISNTDAFVSITDNDEYNLIAAMYAETLGIPKIVTKIAAKSRTKVLHEDSRIGIISREDVAADRILGYTRAILNAGENDSVESLYRLVDGQLEFIEFRVASSDKYIGRMLKDIRLKKNILLAGIIRQGRLIIPHGEDILLVGDTALIASVGHKLSELGDIYE